MTAHAMTPDQWRAVEAILRDAVALEPAQRDAFVADACSGNPDLRREVESLLAAHRADDSFLERPAAVALGARGDTAPLSDRLERALAGRYHIEGELAQGGMATVYVARDLRLKRQVAIKVLREEIAAAVGAERFLEEIRVTASLQHPHILQLFESGSADGLLWYVMPLIEGETLRARLKRDGRLPVAVAVQLAREIAEALEYAHGRGLVHRDVKPENVLLQRGHALVADFGIALAIEHAGGERLTRTGITLGTPQYMAPEQASGERAIDARADVYALGAVLYEMLDGESPFAAASRQEMLRRIMQEPATSLVTRRNEVAPSIDAAVNRALAKRPEDRFPSAAAFASALAVAQPAKAPPAQSSQPRARGGRRQISARVAFYAAVVMGVMGLAGGWTLARSSLVQRGTNALSALPPPPLESAGTWGGKADEAGLAVMDRTGRVLQTIPARRAWTPRFSPDGRLVAYGAFGDGRNTSDIWVTELASGKTHRVTDDKSDSNDPQWSPDGTALTYSTNAPDGKDVMSLRVDGGEPWTLARRNGAQFPTDWLRNGSAVLVMDDGAGKGWDIVVQPTDGSPPRPYAATRANESAGRFSPDGRWVAYTSDESGRAEVYIDSYPQPGKRVRVSWNGGAHPVWRGDGRELFYWDGSGALVAAQLGAPIGDAAPEVGKQPVLFRAQYNTMLNTMYDVSADGQRFLLVRGS